MSSWQMTHNQHVIHILKAIDLAVNLRFLGTLYMHPVSHRLWPVRFFVTSLFGTGTISWNLVVWIFGILNHETVGIDCSNRNMVSLVQFPLFFAISAKYHLDKQVSLYLLQITNWKEKHLCNKSPSKGSFDSLVQLDHLFVASRASVHLLVQPVTKFVNTALSGKTASDKS